MTVLREKLIDVPLPLPAISAKSTRGKSIPHGYLATLQLRWARRQLSVCRAVQFVREASWVAVPSIGNRRSTIQPNSLIKPKKIQIPDKRYRQR